MLRDKVRVEVVDIIEDVREIFNTAVGVEDWVLI
jgi:hypothetical protein